MTASRPAEETAAQPVAAPPVGNVVPRWGACLLVALLAILWAELAGARNLLFDRESVSTWGWIRAGALYGAFALIILAAWERAAPFLRSGRFWLVLLAMVAVFYQPTWLTEDLPRRLGLSGGDVAKEIAMPRTYKPLAAPVPYVARSDERFEPDDPSMGAGRDKDLSAMFAWDVPDGWRVVPSLGRLGRVVSFALPGGDDAECYLSVMAGGGSGSVSDNLNRWRSQFGQTPLSAAEIAALPQRAFFGAQTPLLECDGTFSGAADGAPRPGYKLLAVCLTPPQALITLKLVGPAAIVDAQRGGFDRVCASVRLSQEAQESMGGREDPAGKQAGTAPPATAEPSAQLTWTAPNGWERGADRFGRDVTYNAPSGAECWISVLNGDGGGLAANLERWRGQMGLPPQGGAAPASFDLLGGRGEFIDLQGQGAQAGQSMLVVMRSLADRTVFVKLTGAADAVAAARPDFETFCKSLRTD